VSVLSSGIVPSRRYLEIGFCQSASVSGGPTTATISPPPGLPVWSSWRAEALELASEIGAGPSLPGGVPGIGTVLSSLEDIPGMGTGTSSLSQMEALNNSCENTPGGGGSRLHPSQARASTALLSRWRILWSLKSSNFSSNFPTYCWYATMWELRQFDSPMT
jgi:hypothetical protein